MSYFLFILRPNNMYTTRVKIFQYYGIIRGEYFIVNEKGVGGPLFSNLSRLHTKDLEPKVMGLVAIVGVRV